MKKGAKEFQIGLTTVLAIALLIWGIKYLKGMNMFKKSSYYYVMFDDINGLVKSSSVLVNGYKVGMVDAIHYDYNQQGCIAVKVQVEPKLRIPAGTTAQLSASLLGETKMVLNLADSASRYMKSGDTLYAVNVEGLFARAAKMLPQIEEMVPKMDSILASINSILSNPSINNTLHNAEFVTGQLRSSTRSLNALMQNHVPRLANKLDTLSGNMNEITGNLKQVDYAAEMRKVDSTLTHLKNITEKLNNKDNSLGLMLNDTTLYNNLNNTTRTATELLEDVKAHPGRYINVSVFGKKRKNE